MAHSRCTGPETGLGLGPTAMGLDLYIMPVTVYITQGQGMEPRINELYTRFCVPGPSPVQRE